MGILNTSIIYQFIDIDDLPLLQLCQGEVRVYNKFKFHTYHQPFEDEHTEIEVVSEDSYEYRLRLIEELYVDIFHDRNKNVV